ncbi:hypothetical protein PHMEG_00031670, partial [Phytophthora megakarya]
MGPVLSRSLYIDAIIYGAPSWDSLCKTLNALLYRLRYWNISVSLPKKKVLNLPFPKTQKGVQSFLGSLNYYAKFIEDLPVLAATLYEASDEQLRSGRDFEKPKHAFMILKDRLVATPLLQHPDPGRHLPSWEIVAATGHFLEKASVNEAEYSGLVKGMQLALDMGVQDLVVVGDSRLAIQQLQGVIGCTQLHLLRLLQEAEGLQARFKSLCIVHVKIDFNAAADYISKRDIQDQSSLKVADPGERKLLQSLNQIHEKLMRDPSPREQSLVECAFLATAQNIPKSSPRGLGGDAVTRSKSKQVKATEKSVPGTGMHPDSKSSQLNLLFFRTSSIFRTSPTPTQPLLGLWRMSSRYLPLS